MLNCAIIQVSTSNDNWPHRALVNIDGPIAFLKSKISVRETDFPCVPQLVKKIVFNCFLYGHNCCFSNGDLDHKLQWRLYRS